MGSQLISRVSIFMGLFFAAANSLDLRSAREQPCFRIRRTVPLDPEWVNSVDTWYYPRMSRYDLYNIATDLAGTSSRRIEEGEMYYDSCITFNFHPNGSLISNGYNGRSKEYLTRELRPNMQKMEFYPADGRGYAALMYSTLTDNETFAFLPECTKDRVMAWCVLSTVERLPEETWQKIRRHALSLGFREEYFTELRYTDSCSERNSSSSTTSTPPSEGNGWSSSDLKSDYY